METATEDRHEPKSCHTKAVTVLLELLVPQESHLRDIEAFLYDLEWVGGCRDPNHDPLFDSVHVVKCKAALVKKKAK